MTEPSASPGTFLRQNWIILMAGVMAVIAIPLLARAVAERLAEDVRPAVIDDAGASTFDPDRIYLVCGNDEGAPNELTGCSVGLDGSFADFGNSVRPLTQPLMAPNGSLMAFAEPGQRVVLRNPTGSAELILELDDLSGPLDWSMDGEELLVSDRSAVVVIDVAASAAEGEPALDRFDLPNGQDVLGLARFSPDARFIAVGTKQNDLEADEVYRIVVFDREDRSFKSYGEQVVERDPTTFTGTFADPAFDPLGERLAWADGISGALSVLTLATGEVEQVPLADPPHLITGVSWSPSGLIVVGVDARLRLVDPGNGMAVSSPLPEEWSITASTPAWSADGTRFVTTAQVPETSALLDLILVDLSTGSVELLTTSAVPPAPVTAFPGFPVWSG